MEIVFERMENKDRQLRLLMIVFAGMAVAGLLATWYAIENGLCVTGMHNRVPCRVASLKNVTEGFVVVRYVSSH